MGFLRKLFARIDRSGPCWLWTAGKDHGYGRVKINGKYFRVHRIIWEMYFGPIPDDIHVLHKCDNPPCCNPEHLFLGTQADNVKDMQDKGRGYKIPPKSGERNPNAKLTTNEVMFIREMAMSLSYGEIASVLKLPRTTVRKIILRKTWAHVP
jgi:hypothetical protein